MSARLVWVPGYLSFRKWAVVYYLHGQTGRSTVWENGNQSLGLVNVLAESRLPFVQISYICWKTATKAWNWYKRWLWRNGTWIPYRKNRTIFSEIPLLPEIFRWNDPESRTQFTFQPDFPETCLPPLKSSHNHCFQFLLGSTVVPRGKEDNGYA